MEIHATLWQIIVVIDGCNDGTENKEVESSLGIKTCNL